MARPLAALRTSLAATASNPMTIASWAAIFAAASAARVATSDVTAVLLVAGVGAGSLTWFGILAEVMSLLRRRVGERTLKVAGAVFNADDRSQPKAYGYYYGRYGRRK